MKKLLIQAGNNRLVTCHTTKFRSLIQKYHPDLVVLYFHEKSIQKNDLSALVNYVSNGGSILAVHSASASFKQEAMYHQILGGRFIEHGPICSYSMIRTDHEFEFLAEIDDPLTIKDELYLHEYDENVRVLLETIINNRREPVAWIKNHGLGTVAYFSPGHRAEIFKNTTIKKVIHALIDWSLSHA